MAVQSVQVVIDDVTHTLTYNSSTGMYEKVITAPNITSFNKPNGAYSVQIIATDVAGNKTTETRDLIVKEKTPPTITITNPTSSARVTTASPTITGTVVDEANGSGININTFVLKIDGVAVDNKNITFTSVSNGYNFSYTASGLTNGSHTITVDVKDNDGNAATQKSVSFTVDTIAPSLTVTAPAYNLITNSSTLTISGSTNDATSNPVTVTITVNGVSAGAVTVNGDGTFSKQVTLSEGANTIVVKATDSAGLQTTITRTVTLDTVAPKISNITITPNPVNTGDTFTIKVSVSD